MFWSVTLWVALLARTTGPKSMEGGVSVTDAALAFPAMGTVMGEAGSVLLMLSMPLRAPSAVGV